MGDVSLIYVIGVNKVRDQVARLGGDCTQFHPPAQNTFHGFCYRLQINRYHPLYRVFFSQLQF